VQSRYKAISPYLIDASRLNNRHCVVKEEPRSLMGYPPLIIGSQDDGNYIFTDATKAEFLQNEPDSAAFMRPFIGAQEFINGTQRWILALHQAQPQILRQMPKVLERMQAVKQFRLKSQRKSTLALANTPTLYGVNVIPEKPFLVIPRVSSEKRDYVPMGYIKPPVVPNDAVLLIQNAALWHFSILTSRMHMAWMRQFAGRLKSDYRYSSGVVYNAFPWPESLQTNTQAQKKLETLAQKILDTRAAHANATLAHLYNPVTMPPALRKAHTALDKAVDKLYRAESFKDDSERVTHLLMRYENLVSKRGAA